MPMSTDMYLDIIERIVEVTRGNGRADVLLERTPSMVCHGIHSPRFEPLLRRRTPGRSGIALWKLSQARG